MRFQEVEIGIEQVSAGMYVCRLDRSWNGAPFPLQGFLVDADDQLDWLRANCRSVWIDVERGLEPRDAPLMTLTRRPAVLARCASRASGSSWSKSRESV